MQPAFIVGTNEAGEADDFFCKIKHIQIDEQLECADHFDVNLTKLESVFFPACIIISIICS